MDCAFEIEGNVATCTRCGRTVSDVPPGATISATCRTAEEKKAASLAAAEAEVRRRHNDAAHGRLEDAERRLEVCGGCSELSIHGCTRYGCTGCGGRDKWCSAILFGKCARFDDK